MNTFLLVAFVLFFLVGTLAPASIAILLLVVGAFLLGLYGAIKNAVVPTAVGVILLAVAMLISVVGH